MAVSSAACRAAPTISSPRTGWSVSKASTAGSPATTAASSSRTATSYTNNQRGLGSVTGRVGYTWGPGLLYVKGGYAYSDNNESLVIARRAASRSPSTGNHSNGYTVGAGLEYMFTQNWSAQDRVPVLQLRQRELHRSGRAGSVRQLPHRRPRRQGGHQLPLQLGRPGGREVLIFADHSVRERPASRRPFCFCEPLLAASNCRLCSVKPDPPIVASDDETLHEPGRG